MQLLKKKDLLIDYMSKKPELVSFKVCPFVQRSVITLLEKKVDFKLTYIDLANPPKWFLKISPLTKVPVLKIKDTVLFESAVINEYLDEVNPPGLHPKDSLKRAQNRAWIEFGSEMIMSHYNMMVAKDKETFKKAKKQLKNQFKRLEKELNKTPCFNGKNFSLVDAAFAPLFMRVSILEDKYPLGFYKTNPKIARWAHYLCTLKTVKNSVVSDFEDVFLCFVMSLNSYYSKQIKSKS